MNTPKEKRLRTVTIDPKSFEGTFAQRLRRRKVFELRLRHFTIREMAERLNVSVGAIQRDLQKIEWALLQRLDSSQANQILNEALAELSAVKDIALAGLEDADGNVRVGLLNMILKTIEVQIGLLQDGGVLPKATQRHQHEGMDGGPIPVAIAQPRVRLTLMTSAESERAMRQMEKDASG